ncbi:hypothetical protein TNCV_700281 [Trichonephila clavipes]|nr:hypothetical protein TNCV_700281 [Trichonephila clavipes]
MRKMLKKAYGNNSSTIGFLPLSMAEVIQNATKELEDFPKNGFHMNVLNSYTNAETSVWMQEGMVKGMDSWPACHEFEPSTIPLETRLVGKTCALNLSRAQTSSRCFGVVVRRGGSQFK